MAFFLFAVPALFGGAALIERNQENRRRAENARAEARHEQQRVREEVQRCTYYQQEFYNSQEQLQVARMEAEKKSDPESYHAANNEILQDFLNKIPTMRFTDPLPAACKGLKSILLLGDVSTGKTSLIREILGGEYMGDFAVGRGHATKELLPVFRDNKMVIFDSPGTNNHAWSFYNPASLCLLHTVHTIIVHYETSLSTAKNLVQIAKATTKGTQQLITVRTKIDLWGVQDQKTLQQEMEEDKKFLAGLGIDRDVKMYATSKDLAKLPPCVAGQCQNDELKRELYRDVGQ